MDEWRKKMILVLLQLILLRARVVMFMIMMHNHETNVRSKRRRVIRYSLLDKIVDIDTHMERMTDLNDAYGYAHSPKPSSVAYWDDYVKFFIRRRESLPAEDSAPQVPAYVNEFIKANNDTMDLIAQMCVAPKVTEDPATTQRKSLYGVVAEMEEFDDDQKIEIVHKLAHSPEDADVLFGLPEASRVKYLKHIMKKKAGRV